MRRRVTFSRNLTLSLSRTCVSHCKYCAFATHRPASARAGRGRAAARRSGAAQGQGAARPDGRRPGHHPGVPSGSPELGFDDFVAYVVWCCERALERGILPHTNLGALAREDLERLREVTASQGMMLESLRDDLVAIRARRRRTRRSGSTILGGGRAQDSVHERDPRRDRRVGGRPRGGARGARGAARRARPPPGGDPPELRPAPALLRRRAGRDRGRGAARRAARRGGARAAGLGERDHARRHAPARARVPAADARRRHPDPAEPVRLVASARGGGRHRSRRPVGERRPHLARAPVPLRARDAQAARRRRLRADRAPVRLPAVHGRGLARAGRARRDQDELLVVHPAARLGPARGPPDPLGARPRGDRARATARRCRRTS